MKSYREITKTQRSIRTKLLSLIGVAVCFISLFSLQINNELQKFKNINKIKIQNN